MAIRSKEFVGIAEGIKSHELSTKGRIESLRGTISELSGAKRSLESQISYLEAALAAAYEDTDEDGDPDYGRISAIEAQISQAEGQLSEVEGELDDAHGELTKSEAELDGVMEEKARTLFEIQERARKTSNNIAVAGGMYGAYSGVGSSLQSSMQTSLASLSQAASILDGSVDGFTGGGSGGGGGGSSTGGRGMTSQGELSTSALSAFAVGAATSSILSGNSSPASAPSSFTTNHTNGATPATTSGFRSGQQSINPQKTLNFNSEQSGNTYAVSAFSVTETSEQQSNQASKYQSSQKSVDFGNPFNPFSRWGQSKKTANTTITEFSGLSVDKNSLYGDRYFVKGNNYGAFCEYIKNINQYKQVNCNEARTISAKDIEGIYLNDSEAKDSHFFWNRGMKYEMDSESFFMQVASYIPEFQARTKNGESVESIIADPNLRTCYELFFQKPIEVYEVDGFYEFAGSGRHRCMAAQKLGIDIPVRVVARYERKDIPSAPPRNIFSDSRQYGNIVDKLTVANVTYRPIRKITTPRSTTDIVSRLSGGDLTQGSCSSLALAYAGNKAGYDVLDFRDGASRDFFSSRKSIQEIANLPNVLSSVVYDVNDIENAKVQLRKIVSEKEYYFAIGQHAAIIRKHQDHFEYLELQHPSNGNGWHTLDANTLIARFGCKKERAYEMSSYLIDVETLSNNEEFLNILGYINTSSAEQRKGGCGSVK